MKVADISRPTEQQGNTKMQNNLAESAFALLNTVSVGRFAMVLV
jgi:hypothetical protein